MRWLNHRKPLLSAFALLLFCLLLPSCYPPAYAMTYQVTEAELTALEQNLQTLAEHSKSKQALLEEQSKQLRVLNEQLKQSLAQNEKTQSSLKAAETSLQKYAEEVKHKDAVKNRQRNTWAAVAIGAVVWAITK